MVRLGQVSVGNWAYHHGKYFLNDYDIFYFRWHVLCLNWLALNAIVGIICGRYKRCLCGTGSHCYIVIIVGNSH